VHGGDKFDVIRVKILANFACGSKRMKCQGALPKPLEHALLAVILVKPPLFAPISKTTTLLSAGNCAAFSANAVRDFANSA